jgi:UDP-N-acetylmuramoylalanine--D-glutamate ligase
VKISELKNKKIAIVGYGVEGAAVADFLRSLEIPFSILDKKPKIALPKDAAYIQTGDDYLKNLDDYEVIIRAPGIQPFLPELLAFEKNGGIIETQMRLFFENYPNRQKIIGVTGTKGKGTTSILIQKILQAAGLPVRLGGNIGTGVLNLLSEDALAEDPWIVLELSSFQLQDLGAGPHIAVVLMVTSDHLDYHRSIEEYIAAKAPIAGYQKADDFVIYNADYPSSVKIAEGSNNKAKKIPFSTVSGANFAEDGAFGEAIGKSSSEVVDGALAVAEEDSVYLQRAGHRELLGKISELKLRGYHNTQNICAAALVGATLGISPKIIWRACADFAGYEHRLQFVVERSGIKFYDDSIATIPESSITAADSFTEPVILFAGGSDKGVDYKKFGADLAELSKRKSLKAVITLGLVGQRIAEGLENAGYAGKIVQIQDAGAEAYNQAFDQLKNLASTGDVVLLSPGTASFDMFKNYKERGDYFNELAKNF